MITEEELLSQVRRQNFHDLSQIMEAYMQGDGRISVQGADATHEEGWELECHQMRLDAVAQRASRHGLNPLSSIRYLCESDTPTSMGDRKSANDAHDRLAEVYRELRDEGQRERLLPLLNHADAAVRA